MGARESLETALRYTRRVEELIGVIRSLESGVTGISYDKFGGSSSDPSWAIQDRVERIAECKALISEMEEFIDGISAAIWRIDTGIPAEDWAIGTVLTRLYIDDAKTVEIAKELGTSSDGVYNLKRRGIRWLDKHNIL